MKNVDIRGIVSDIFGFVFSGVTLFILAIALFVYLIVGAAEADSKNRETRRVATELCYNHGMVLVESDAGPRCADPKGLLKLK